MDRMREKHIAEINRLKEAIKKTSSKYLKNDYGKSLKECKTN